MSIHDEDFGFRQFNFGKVSPRRLVQLARDKFKAGPGQDSLKLSQNKRVRR